MRTIHSYFAVNIKTQNKMKKIISSLLAVFTAFSLSFAAIPMMDDEPEEAIPLQYNEPGEGEENANLRGNSFFPIIATYSQSLSRINVIFMYNYGEIDIRLSNLTAGGISTVQTSSDFGSVNIPIVSGNGYYCIELICGGLTVCYGYFNVL